MTRQRAASGPPHLLVDVAVVDAVERRRRTRRQRAADDGRDDEPERRTPCAAKNITGTVVSSNSSMTRGLVRPTYAATTSRQRRARVGERGLRGGPSRQRALDRLLDVGHGVPRGAWSRTRSGPAAAVSSLDLGMSRLGTARAGTPDVVDPDRGNDRSGGATWPKLDWNETDDLAVDTVRVLAMDAVQKVGNGHPGTAMSLAPAAYLLFQKVMRHNPADPHWPGRDRFVLSCGHSSLTLYIQLYLGGWGLELEDLKSLRTWGSKTPGHPEYGHTAGVETTTGPLGQGVGNAVGMAMAARREHGLLDPNAARASRRSTTSSMRCAATATSRRASAARRRRSPAPSSSAT